MLFTFILEIKYMGVILFFLYCFQLLLKKKRKESSSINNSTDMISLWNKEIKSKKKKNKAIKAKVFLLREYAPIKRQYIRIELKIKTKEFSALFEQWIGR